MALAERDILDALRHIQDPDLGRDIVDLGFVRNVRVDGDRVALDINLTTPACPVKDQLRDQARTALLALPGVREASVNMTSEVRSTAAPDASGLLGIRNLVAVGSGKGGVGKSTVAVNVAAALAQTGARVGLLDGDIYGPTIPIMMGMQEAGVQTAGDRLIPYDAHGVRFMSMGFMAPGDQPLIWRGPMAHKALQQTLLQTEWGELDYLLIDLPPGTGDVHLTLVQTVALTGAVIVSTPQDVGLTISRKTLRMFQQTRVPILGLIENMSYYACPHCGQRDDIFGHGGTEQVSGLLGIPFLGGIPLDGSIRDFADRGTPVVLGRPDGAAAKAYRDIAGQLAAQVSIRAFAPAAPVIVEE